MLTDKQKEKLARRNWGYFVNLPERAWSSLIILLPPGWEGRVDFRYQFLAATHRYWRPIVGLPRLDDKKQTSKLKKASNDLGRVIDTLRELGPRLRRQDAEEASKAIPVIQNLWGILWLYTMPKFVDTGGSRDPRRFVFSMIRLWKHCGGKVGRRTNKKGEPSGPLIRYLKLACEMVMGQDAPAPDTLASYVRQFQRRYESAGMARQLRK